ncbi:MAG: prephenate dehydrogenase/arogenate dehydrogenase family protein [Planctomycetes bacterium]|nr:prephenate dehydrogenase/arogenate dehydrogenase family protein [Planctomycetota bacterium]
MLFKQISIIGVGLLGGSLGMAAKRLGLAGTVVGIGHRDSTLKQAVACGAIDRYTVSPAEGVRGSDLVVLATPVGLFGRLMQEAAGSLADGCLITDVGSTKRAVLEAVVPHVPAGCRFVGSHPLAGSEDRGIDAASVDLYEDALVLVVPTPRSDAASVAAVEQFWRALGSRTRQMDAETHDRLLARTSHLPHLVAAALVDSLSPEAESLAATGFLDTTRIASGDAAMWRDIFMTNRDELLASIEAFEAAVAAMKQALADGDAETVQSLLEQAKRRRDRMLKSR